MKVVAVGDIDFIAGFQLAGVKEVYESNDASKAKNTLEKIKERKDVAIVLIQRKFAKELRNYINEWKFNKGIYPIILELPDHKDNEEYEDPMSEIIKRAIGVDLNKR